MTMLPDTLETMKRRLAWRASRRGIREMDIVMGGFAAQNLPGMSAQELAEFEMILDIPDQQLLSWLTSQDTVPKHVDSPMLRQILAYVPKETPL